MLGSISIRHKAKDMPCGLIMNSWSNWLPFLDSFHVTVEWVVSSDPIGLWIALITGLPLNSGRFSGLELSCRHGIIG